MMFIGVTKVLPFLKHSALVIVPLFSSYLCMKGRRHGSICTLLLICMKYLLKCCFRVMKLTTMVHLCSSQVLLSGVTIVEIVCMTSNSLWNFLGVCTKIGSSAFGWYFTLSVSEHQIANLVEKLKQVRIGRIFSHHFKYIISEN